eukprot:SAG31_NODE_22432_length_525_cov_1.685446_1_plen_31_part_10
MRLAGREAAVPYRIVPLAGTVRRVNLVFDPI